MSTATRKRAISLALCLMLLFSICGAGLAFAADAPSDALRSGTYQLTEKSYDDAAYMKMAADLVIDRDKNTFEVWRDRDGTPDKRSEGKLSFDKKSGVYTVNFTTPENQTSTFTCDDTGSSITFTTPLWFGTARMNVVDENEQFIPYTAVRKGADIPQTETTITEPTAESPADTLLSGTYQLTEDSYDDAAYMKMAADLIIDRDKNTFEVWRDRDGTPDKRSEGQLSFDKKSGVYTVNFTTPENQTSTFTCDNTGSSITFTTPLWFGTARMNVVDENEQFIPYTAVRKGADIPQTETTTTEPTTEKETEKQSEQTTEAPNYFIMDGADGMVAQGAEVPYELRCNGASERFETLYLDGEIVPTKCFEIRAGAATTTLVLSAGFMKSLDAGTHTLRVAFTDGSVETTLTVRDVFADAPAQNDSGTGAQEADTDEALETEPTEQDANAQPADDASAQTVKSAVRESVVPNTGDEFSPSFWVTVLLLAAGCALSVIVFGKRKAAYGSGR